MKENKTMDRGILQIKAKEDPFRRVLSGILMMILQVSTRDRGCTVNEDIFRLRLSSILMTMPQVSTNLDLRSQVL